MGLNKYPCLPHVSIAIHSGPKTPPRSWKNWRYDTTILNWTLSILPLCGWFIYTWYHDIIYTYIYIYIHIHIYIYIYISIYIATSSFYPHMGGQGRPCAWQIPLALAPSWAASPFRPGRPSPKRSQGIHNLSIQCSAGPASHFGWTRNMSVCRPVEEINIDQLL